MCSFLNRLRFKKNEFLKITYQFIFFHQFLFWNQTIFLQISIYQQTLYSVHKKYCCKFHCSPVTSKWPWNRFSMFWRHYNKQEPITQIKNVKTHIFFCFSLSHTHLPPLPNIWWTFPYFSRKSLHSSRNKCEPIALYIFYRRMSYQHDTVSKYPVPIDLLLPVLKTYLFFFFEKFLIKIFGVNLLNFTFFGLLLCEVLFNRIVKDRFDTKGSEPFQTWPDLILILTSDKMTVKCQFHQQCE